MGIAIKVKGQNYFKYSGLGKVSYSDIVAGDSGSSSTPTTKAERGLSFGGAVVNVTYGDTVNPPTATSTATGGTTGTCHYTSSDTSLAVVNASTGAVTLMDNRSGTVTITLVIEENSTFKEDTASYIINITAQSSSGGGESGGSSSSEAVQGALTSYPEDATHLKYILKKTNTFDPSTDEVCYIVDLSDGDNVRYYYYNKTNYDNQSNEATAVAFKKNTALGNATYCDDWICANVKVGGYGITMDANETERTTIKNGITGFTDSRSYDNTSGQTTITWCSHSSREIYQKIQTLISKTISAKSYPLGLAELLQIKNRTEVANLIKTRAISSIVTYNNPNTQRLVNVVTGTSSQFMIKDTLDIMTSSQNNIIAIGYDPKRILQLYNVAVGDSASFADKYSD